MGASTSEVVRHRLLGGVPAAVWVLAAAIPLAGARPGPLLAQEAVDRSIAIAPDAYIMVFNLAGSVRVAGWDRDSIAVTGTVAGGGRFYLGGSGASAKLGVWESGSGGAGGAPPSADLDVRVPAGSTVWVKSSEADVRVDAVRGGVDVYAVTGDVHVRGAPRQVYAESMGGRVEIEATAPSIRSKTAGGDIRFSGTSRDLTLTTVGGEISVSTPSLERGRFESVTGDIEFEGGVERGGSLVFRSHSGAVRLTLPRQVDAELAIDTYEGEIRNELGSHRSPVSRPLGGEELSFRNGEGGAQVSVQTFSGRVLVRAR